MENEAKIAMDIDSVALRAATKIMGLSRDMPECQFKAKVQIAVRDALEEFWPSVYSPGAAEHVTTPAASWRTKGEPDPHGDRYDCERAQLCMGHLSDDELANGAFMNYDQPLNIAGILAKTHTSPIGWMTGVKDRIRWLSRALIRATTPLPEAEQRERFEAACYAYYRERHADGKLADSDSPPGTRADLMWRRPDGTYGVLMFNASWWAWQAAVQP